MDKRLQIKVFVKHFELAEESGLPLYLHSRSSRGLFERIMKENRHRFSNGVVNSFTGTKQELSNLLDLGLYIGVSGCSLGTSKNLEVIKLIPLDRILIETDSPFYEITPKQAGYQYVKTKFEYTEISKYDRDKLLEGRNEPCTIV